MEKYPKLIDPEILASIAEPASDFPSVLPSQSKNKEFFYFIALIASALLTLLILFLANISGRAVNDFFEAISFLDIKLSDNLISDLKFPNPVTVSILAANIVFLTYGFLDLSLSKNQLDTFCIRKFRQKDGITVLDYNNSQNHFSESRSLSFAVHVLILLFILLNILFTWHPKPKIQVTTIEFIPQQIESKIKAPVKTKRRAEKNSIDQGKHDPKNPIKPPTPASGSPKQNKAIKPSPKASASLKSQSSTSNEQKPEINTKSPEPPKPFLPQPKLFQNSEKKINLNDSKPIPQLLDYLPNSNQQASGSRTSTGSGPMPKSGTADGNSTGRDLVARLGSIPRAPDSLGGGRGGSGGLGTLGNPPPNPYGDRDPSVAAKADINFGPYMSALQRKIKRSWRPPRGTESNTIKVTFSINSDGRLANLKIVQACADQQANQAALNAVINSSPFDPLPPGSNDSIDIEFTFDYNVFQRQRY